MFLNDKYVEGVAYLKGLAEGLEINPESKEGKLLVAVIDVLGQFAKALQGMEIAYSELNEYVESIDDDLSDIENGIMEDGHDEFDDDSSDDEEDEFDADDYLSTLNFEKDIFDDDKREGRSKRGIKHMFPGKHMFPKKNDDNDSENDDDDED